MPHQQRLSSMLKQQKAEDRMGARKPKPSQPDHGLTRRRFIQASHASEDRDRMVRIGCQSLASSAELIESAGIPVGIVSTGGTGTFSVSGQCPGITEVQPGSYLLMDAPYVNRGAFFQPTLTVLTTVISKPIPGRAVVDCGVKAMSGERGLPTVKGKAGVELKALHAEHGLLEMDVNSDAGFEVGHRIELLVQYADATMNLHRCLYGVRSSNVEETFRIEH